MRLIQVVPRIGPWDGVGDYAVRLAEELREHHCVSSTFVEAGERRGAAGRSTSFEVRECGRPEFEETLAACGAARDGARVLLHYVGYGYAARGAPLWLERAVAHTRRELGYRLGVVFHELYATGRPWNSSFWLSGLQKLIARRLAAECDGALLTREGNLRWLEGTGALAGKAAEVLPMCSTVGEPSNPDPASARPGVLIVWGSAAMKRTVYGRRWPYVLAACRHRRISRIVDIGAPFLRYPSAAGIDVQARGLLPAPQISGILEGARFGLVVYPASFLAKSTLFAAYAAHGVVPLLADDGESIAMDGLTVGQHFLQLTDRRRESDDTLDEIAASARAWYSGHTTTRHADAVLRMLGGAAP